MSSELTLDVIQWALLIGLVASNFRLWVEVRAMQQSTHQVTYVNPFADKKKPQEFETLSEQMNDELKKAQDEFFGNIN